MLQSLEFDRNKCRLQLAFNVYEYIVHGQLQIHFVRIRKTFSSTLVLFVNVAFIWCPSFILLLSRILIEIETTIPFSAETK